MLIRKAQVCRNKVDTLSRREYLITLREEKIERVLRQVLFFQGLKLKVTYTKEKSVRKFVQFKGGGRESECQLYN